ncbi:acyl-CoA dehydrogenase [Kordiimonas sediminis]|uniref:Acyl-CoA dehydrogenase n=2 Tax=Kordiimonas sediminis TaxID=1735581 RepID=A0A919AJ63_9PROT|nr:acyl-CoA dehydrogenase [Kordiimonas sediminis]
MFRDMTIKVIEKEILPFYEAWEEAGLVDRQLWNTLGEAGILGANLLEEYGGSGAPAEVTQMIVEEMSRLNCGGFASSYNIHSNIVMPYLMNLGTDAQKAAWLPKMGTGEVVGALAMTEPGAGSDVANIRTSAVRDGDEWVLNGSKIFITNGLHADLVLVAAKTDRNAGAKGISLMLVDTSLPGFSRGGAIHKIGQNASDTCELFFENVRLPADSVLGTEGMGFIHMMNELPRERLGCAALALGACDGALAETIAYVTERKAFGAKVASFQNTRFKLADMKSKVELARAYYNQCKAAYDKDEMTAEMAAILKYTSTEIQCEVVNECLQLFGGYGYTKEYAISRYYLDARVQTIYAGTSEIMKEVIARSMVGR